jgi:fructokinase
LKILLGSGEALFAGQVGSDVFGRFLEESLTHYGVDTRFLHKYSFAHTALAFVTLDDHGDRSFAEIEEVAECWSDMP